MFLRHPYFYFEHEEVGSGRVNLSPELGGRLEVGLKPRYI